ncbi:hypothetical protein PTKIN_Ptkin07bG0007400 [Pterospermum kingtungense]
MLMDFLNSNLNEIFWSITLFTLHSQVYVCEPVTGNSHGCVIAPLTFWLFWTVFDIGPPYGTCTSPYAVIMREMAILGCKGFSELPNIVWCYIVDSFIGALIVNLLRDVTPKKISLLIPIPMAMAVPFYIGAYFAVDMFVGTLI